MNTNRLVSVIMPVYNGASFVEEAIESILAQTYRHFELIIINDNSTDNTPNILQAFKQKYPETIKVVNLRSRHGAFGAANAGIKYAKGAYLAIMDSDDKSHPKRLEKQVAYLKKHPEVIVLGSHTDLIDKNGNTIGKKNFAQEHEAIYYDFFVVHPMVHPSCIIRRSMLPRYDKLYHNQYGINDDYFTFFTLLNYGKFANIPETLFYYRIHLDNSSLQNLKQKFFNTVRIRIRATKDFKYKPGVINIMKLCVQIGIVSIIPESLLLKLYLVTKGILSVQDLFPQFLKVNVPFLRRKRLVLSQ